MKRKAMLKIAFTLFMITFNYRCSKALKNVHSKGSLCQQLQMRISILPIELSYNIGPPLQ